mgnify:CR=1 FL=1
MAPARVLALVLAILTLGGCAAEGPVTPAGLGQKTEAARTRADHQEIAAVYEQQAGVDKAAAERHRNLARAYERRHAAGGPLFDNTTSTLRSEKERLVAHCENLASKYRDAAETNLALAKLHRRMAAESP